MLRPRREGWVIDGTVGMGGHAAALLETAPASVRLLGLDVDPEALERSRARLAGFGDRVTPATALLDRLPEPELTRVLTEYGDEPQARRIARAIVRRRPLRTTTDLVAAVKSAVPRAAWPKRLHVATRTFQAIRMAVNDEPGALRQALPQAASLLAPGGRLGVIAFHSGEDRIVKQTFRELSRAEYAEIEPSPRMPTDDEVRANPRARSAKLRVLERIQ